ncbi:MAG TPA: HAMP domain-containing sensor histidine kinase, partial [bacterium]
TPIVIDHERFTIFTVIDISHEKRRKVLERVFFHDVLNTAGALRGYLDLLQSAEHWEVNEILQNINRIGEQLIDEILAQKQLVAAEDNELCAEPTELDSLEFLNDLMTVYRGHPLSENRTMVIDRHSPGVRLSIDVTLLRRVICNMVKNALESSENGETITIGCRRGDDDISFWVHSPKFIPREIQLQIFKRSFSTKGEGRGLGTYSMKLLSERYLKGKVWFTSSETEGTVFTASYPISMNGKNSDYAHSVNFINSLMK